jgi:hypothetical protein
MTGGLCDVPGGSHDGTDRFYPCGWRCTTHAPQARPTTTPTTTTSPTPRRQTRPQERPRITAALRIDAGEGFAAKDAPPGEFTWKTPPRARYECVACNWRSEIVTGAIAVRTFLNHIRATHTAACPAASTEGAHAA